MIQINDTLFIVADELRFSAARSGGPGGQHVNKTASKVLLQFNVSDSPSLTEDQKRRICAKLVNRINVEGDLLITSEDDRSQHRNKELVVEKFIALIADALKVPKKRKPTRATKGSKERRIKEKKERGRVKNARGRVSNDASD